MTTLHTLPTAINIVLEQVEHVLAAGAVADDLADFADVAAAAAQEAADAAFRGERAAALEACRRSAVAALAALAHAELAARYPEAPVDAATV